MVILVIIIYIIIEIVYITMNDGLYYLLSRLISICTYIGMGVLFTMEDIDCFNEASF